MLADFPVLIRARARFLVRWAVIARNRTTRCRRRRCLRRSLSAAPWIAETYRLKGVKSERRLRALATALPCCFDRDETTYRFRSLTVFLYIVPLLITNTTRRTAVMSVSG